MTKDQKYTIIGMYQMGWDSMRIKNCFDTLFTLEQIEEIIEEYKTT